MCFDLSEYDPFEPLIIYVYSDSQIYEVNEPMSDYDWKEWLEVEGYE